MGLMQKALETYDAMEGRAGLYEEGKEPLAPVGHIVTRAQIEVTIDGDGEFITARPAEKDAKIIIPVTEESAGRTSAPAAHPLCDQLGYLPGGDPDKVSLYLTGLRQWAHSAHSHPKVEAVLRYVEQGTLREDLASVGISTEKDKDLVCWRVVGQESREPSTWADVTLMQAYTAYYLSRQESEKQLCMLTGESAPITWQHLKGAFALNGNAKIISANDSANFTYRGRFTAPGEAASVGYLASQKAHNALKWLISTQGSTHGGRAFVCWNPRGLPVPEPLQTLSAPTTPAGPPSYKNYCRDLREKLTGFKRDWQPSDQVIIAAFDAATAGRLAVTYYNELLGSDFWERLAHWEETCCWQDGFGRIYSPTLYHIIAYAFGAQRGDEGKVEPDEKLIAPQMQRLLACRIDQALFPLDMMRAIAARAGNLQAYNPKNNRRRLLFTACAVIRKYYFDHKKEEFALALEPEKKDRSYQWGRMLAVLEKIERDTYDSSETRETNAIRMQSVFVKRPGYALQVIMGQLKTAYYPRLPLGMRIHYDRLAGEIMEQLSQCEGLNGEHYGDPLGESYLLGYYLQKNAFYTRKDNEEAEEE